MRRANNLYGSIPTRENLDKAFRKAARGKRHRPEVAAFQADFDANIRRLRDQLLAHEPDIGHYRFFTVRDPKVRTICAASFPERVLHHGIMNICEPVLDRYAIFDSYACRKGKGNRKGLARAGKFARSHPWYLKLDIAKYFDSIDHAVMTRLLAKRFKETELLGLFEKILNTYHTAPGRGIPIGNLISQHLANFYLGHLGRWIKETRKIKGYLRYMDDFVLFGPDKSFLKNELSEIEKFLQTELKLGLKQNIQLNRCRLGIPFLGFRVFPNHVRLSPRSLRRYSEKLRAYERNFIQGRWTEEELIRHVMPLNDFAAAGDSLGFRRRTVERFGVLS